MERRIDAVLNKVKEVFRGERSLFPDDMLEMIKDPKRAKEVDSIITSVMRMRANKLGVKLWSDTLNENKQEK